MRVENSSTSTMLQAIKVLKKDKITQPIHPIVELLKTKRARGTDILHCVLAPRSSNLIGHWRVLGKHHCTVVSTGFWHRQPSCPPNASRSRGVCGGGGGGVDFVWTFRPKHIFWGIRRKFWGRIASPTEPTVMWRGGKGQKVLRLPLWPLKSSCVKDPSSM